MSPGTNLRRSKQETAFLMAHAVVVMGALISFLQLARTSCQWTSTIKQLITLEIDMAFLRQQQKAGIEFRKADDLPQYQG